jgi:hypothetical protein
MMAIFLMCNIGSKIVAQDDIWAAKVKPRVRKMDSVQLRAREPAEPFGAARIRGHNFSS